MSGVRSAVMMIATLSRFEVCKAVAYHFELRDPAQ